MLMQRFGRCTRDTSQQGVAILIAEPRWFYCDDAGPNLGNKRKIPSQHGIEDLQRKARKTQLTTQPTDTRTDDLEGHVPRRGEVECADDGMIVDLAEEECPTMSRMDVDTVGMLIVGDKVDGARADTDGTHLETLRRDELEAPDPSWTLLARAHNAPQWNETPVNELGVGQADGLRGVVSEEKIKAFVGGKKAKVGTKRRDIDDYLKLFINAHRLPRNTHCWRVHSNSFFSNHGGFLFRYPFSYCLLFFQWSSTHRKTAALGVRRFFPQSAVISASRTQSRTWSLVSRRSSPFPRLPRNPNR